MTTQHIKTQHGLIYLFTGDGKGKTSAALGILTRALAHGWKVGWISWYKEASWGISEHNLAELLSEEARQRLVFLPIGKGFYLKEAHTTVHGTKIAKIHNGAVVDHTKETEHIRAAQEALKKAEEILSQVDVLILDEVCNAVSDSLIPEKALMDLLEKRGKTHVILTGRSASVLLKTTADLVSIIQKEKHPFDSGRLAVQGLDF